MHLGGCLHNINYFLDFSLDFCLRIFLFDAPLKLAIKLLSMGKCTDNHLLFHWVLVLHLSIAKAILYEGLVLLFYFVSFVLLMDYIFAPGIAAPWHYEITVEEAIFRSKIMSIVILFSAFLYYLLLSIDLFKKYRIRRQMIAAIIIAVFLLIL